MTITVVNPDLRGIRGGMPLLQLLDTVGDGSGITEMTSSISSYYCVPTTSDDYYIYRMNIYIEDDAKFSGEFYGANTALTNGIIVSVENQTETLSTLTAMPVKKIFEWGLMAGVDVILTDVPAGGHDVVVIRWSFDKHGGPIRLRGEYGEFFNFKVQDDLGTGSALLESHEVSVQGIVV